MTDLPHDWYPAEVPDTVILHERSCLYSSFAFLHHRSRRRPSVCVGGGSGIYAGSYFVLGPEGEVQIGSYCSIAGTVISSDGRVTIGDHTFIGYGTVLADGPQAMPPASRERLGGSDGAPGEITIGDNVWIGARAVILGATQIGPDAVIGAGAVLDRQRVPPGAIVAGNPPRVVGSAA
jgi:acetyltransferase-like isoleucine patch superfamily enzyme